MKHLDDLPQRHRTHDVEAAAVRAFDAILGRSPDLIPQGRDVSDYGTDVQVEVIDQARATNVRIHVQIKGTDAALNADGSVSVTVSRVNLNYLLAQPYSVFVCYHRPTDSLRVRSADAVMRKYEHGGGNWTDHASLTVTFTETLTVDRLRSLAGLARSGAAAARNARFAQTAAEPEAVAALIRAAPPHLHVPDEPRAAVTLLQSLFESGRSDAAISAAFDRFCAVLGLEHDALAFAYMAEINLGMDGLSAHTDRIVAAVDFLAARIEGGHIGPTGLRYCIGNAYSALNRDQEAVAAFDEALAGWSPDEGDDLRAQILKNLGDAHAGLGDTARAVALYRDALRLAPWLAEAHHALGRHAMREGDYAAALAHFDQVIFAEGPQRRRSSVPSWRVNVLFNLGDGKAAFREIFGLLGDAADEGWIWQWSAQQVSLFGRKTDENARLSLPFWDRYLKANPECPGGTRERLLNILYLRQGKAYDGPDYAAFQPQFEAGVVLLHDETAAYLWDRLGHWAEDEDDHGEAERCFRRAYDLATGEYGYCLGSTLLQLDRPADALPLLLEQAEGIQPDDKSWCQVATAYAELGRDAEAAAAYETAIALNPDGAGAWFDLGGLHWNARRTAKALEIWVEAMERFPEHAQAERLRAHLPAIFDEPADPAA